MSHQPPHDQTASTTSTAAVTAVNASADTSARVVVTITGAIDLATTANFNGALLKGLDHCTHHHIDHLVVDLGGVSFIDSYGLGSLIAAYRKARTDHQTITIDNPTPPVDRVLRLMALDRIFTIRQSRKKPITQAEVLDLPTRRPRPGH